jgi:serine/threonine-protein kinase
MADRIGHYSIVAELGRGGMGVVYKAHEESLNRFVAIKVLGEHLTEDPAHVQRFIREAQSAARLNHPNIVQIYAVNQEEGKHYFVMEYVSGKSLQQILRRGPLEPVQVARIGLQTASGLQAAHEQNIIHRDIKPANLMIDERGLVKIADFGLALMGGGASRLTATGMFMGTPGYLSPEQCLDQNVDHRTDIYSLGVTLFEALSGKVPFSADSPLALLRQIVEVEPPDLGELNPEIDQDLRSIVARMMVKDRDLRVSNCGEIIGGLEAFLAARGASGNLVERLAATASGEAPPPPTVIADNLESEPTLAVPSDGIKAELPSAPPPVPPPAVETEVPVVETAPLEESSRKSGRRLALVAALVVVLGLAAVVTAGLVAWRTGLFDVASQMLDSEEAVAPEEPTPVEDSSGEPTETAPVGGEQKDPDQAETATPSEDEQPAAQGSLPAPDQETTETSSPPAEPPSQSMNSTTQSRETMTAAPGGTESPPPRRQMPVAPPPRGTVVIAVGETLFAGEAETFMEAALTRAGIELVDEYSIPGVSDIIAGDAARAPGDVRRLIRPYARSAVMIRVEYLGERPLMYMGQRDIAFQARVSIVPIDLHGLAPVANPTKLRVEYTQLNAQRVAEEKLRAPAHRMAELIKGF